MTTTKIPHGPLFPSLEAEGQPHTSPDAQPHPLGGSPASSSRPLEVNVAGPVEDPQPYRLRAVLPPLPFFHPHSQLHERSLYGDIVRGQAAIIMWVLR